MRTRTLFGQVCLYVILLFSHDYCSPLEVSNITDDNLINGNYLINMADKMDNPLLKLLGKAFQGIEQTVSELDTQAMLQNEALENIGNITNNIEKISKKVAAQVVDICNLHPCNEWSMWTNCDAKTKGAFGTQRRMRKCGYSSELCTRKNETKRIEKDFKLCEYSPSCLPSYNLTEEGFCVKLYTDTKTWFDANQQCSDDGGHLITILSATKSSLAEAIFNRYSVSDVWIDGIKKSSTGEWQFVKNFDV
ncbi:uncharacterized protein LOC132721840 [Ruditapes philippinarum]|uniref:uncharacterized protein LOC132721840 n=1 Tax=Ruditapes philippinarum TaxID=129788 RepID=UPI00295C2EC1|nr:uncharacterized protein LOC132721840 [Ruditapes philippinarum]